VINDLVVFIMVWGRPEKESTYRALKRHGYTGKIYLIADDLDESLNEYQNKYGDDLLIFSKTKIKDLYDAGDNSGDLRSTLYPSNIIPDLAESLGYKYFFIFCDDYTDFRYKMNGDYKYIDKANILDLDKIFGYLLEFYKSIPALSLTIAQGGDFISAKDNDVHKSLGKRRKAMNTFLRDIDRPYSFIGRMNEDVTTYINLGNRGYLFLMFPHIAINQPETQSQKGGLTDLYIDYGTYIKSFFTVMYNPSCVKVEQLRDRKKRLHHKVTWRNAVPYIISEDYRKADMTGGEPELVEPVIQAESGG
jgi:hypothetical protein